MLTKRVQHGPVPTHVASIMDGNRRFALARGLPQHAGHRRGKEKVREVMRWCRDLGIHYLTVYALSTENLTSRSPEELATLFDLYEAGFRELAADREIHQAQGRCLAYGARQELVDAIKGILLDHTNGKLRLEDICEERVAQYLYTSGMPDPDLVIRTSGEERVSNFFLWQLAYAELCFIDVYWPAFRKRDFLRALRTYQGRHRRHGT